MSTGFDPENGKQLRRTSWHLDRKSVQINQPPPPEEFSLSIQATTMISDQRPGGRQWRAATSTSLRLVDGMLDLERTPGLTPLGPPRHALGGPAQGDQQHRSLGGHDHRGRRYAGLLASCGF